MRDKTALTLVLLQQLPFQEQVRLDQALKTWWQNIRVNSGLRLTTVGRFIMSELEIESWTFKLNPDSINQRLLILLDQRLQHPYYLTINRTNPSIEFFGSREALLVNLYGDLNKFVENYLN